MKSIRRFQLTVLISGGLLFVVIAALLQYFAVRKALYEQFDARLASQLGSVAGLVEYEPPFLEIEFAEETLPEFSRERDPEYYQIWTFGRTVQKSESLGDDAELTWVVGDDNTAPRAWNVALPDGRSGRAVGAVFALEPQEQDEDEEPDPEEEVDSEFYRLPDDGLADEVPVMVVVAAGRGELTATLALVFTIMAAGSLVLIALLGWLIWFTIGRAMRPVGALAQQADAIEAETLEQRVDIERLPDELAPIGRSINALLGRLESAFARERRTTASIAHELRTPIAELRSAVEVAQRWPNDETLQSTAVENAGEIAVQMQKIVETLLRTARASNGNGAVHKSSIPIAALIDNALSVHASDIAERGLTVRNTIPPKFVVHADRAALTVIVNNLLINAARYATSGGAIECSVEESDEQTRLTIANDCDTLTPEDVPRLFEPFWRKDASRSDARFVGLGLTLVQTVAESAGYDLRAELVDDVFRIHVGLPNH